MYCSIVLPCTAQLGGTVFDLEEAELCYAPQYGSAKVRPGGTIGTTRQAVHEGRVALVRWHHDHLRFLPDQRIRAVMGLSDGCGGIPCGSVVNVIV